MRTFTDKAKREWTVDLNITTVKHVMDALEVNLAQLDEQLLVRLSDDPILLCNVIYVLCREQTNEKGISDEDFGRALGGDSIDAATKALMAELVDFTRSPARRQMWKAVVEKLEKIRKIAATTIEKHVTGSEPDEELQAKLEAVIKEAAIKAVTSSS